MVCIITEMLIRGWPGGYWFPPRGKLKLYRKKDICLHCRYDFWISGYIQKYITLQNSLKWSRAQISAVVIGSVQWDQVLSCHHPEYQFQWHHHFHFCDRSLEIIKKILQKLIFNRFLKRDNLNNSFDSLIFLKPQVEKIVSLGIFSKTILSHWLKETLRFTKSFVYWRKLYFAI